MCHLANRKEDFLGEKPWQYPEIDFQSLAQVITVHTTLKNQ